MMRLARLRADDGVTLAETIVTAVIGALVLILLGTVFTTSLTKSQSATARTTTTSDARVAMEYMTRLLRVATLPAGQTSAFLAASPQLVEFYSSDNSPVTATATATPTGGATTTPTPTPTPSAMPVTPPTPTLVEFAVVTTPTPCLELFRAPGVTSGSTTTWTLPSSGTCIATGTVGSPLFTYYSSGTTSTPIDPPSAPVPAADWPNINSVGVSLALTGSPAQGGQTTVMTNRVSLLNLCNPDEPAGAGNGSQVCG